MLWLIHPSTVVVDRIRLMAPLCNFGGYNPLGDCINIQAELQAHIRTGNVFNQAWADGRLIRLHKNQMDGILKYLNTWWGEQDKQLQIVDIRDDFLVLEVAASGDPLSLPSIGNFCAAESYELRLARSNIEETSW